MDDIIVTGNNSSFIQQFICSLNNLFALKDLGDLSYFLDIEVQRSFGSLFLSQQNYFNDLLKHVDMFSCKSMATPMAAGSSFSIKIGDVLSDSKQYRSIVGTLQYCTITRPDLSFVVNKACQFLHAPTTTHWNLVKRILRYLKTTSQLGLSLSASSPFSLTSYTDVDWANCPDDRRSTSGYCVFLGPNLISWASTKQKVVSRSSVESEYRGLSNAASELIWV